MKKLSILLFLVFLVFSSSVSAHTGLEKSFPSDGQIITDELQEITLDFATKIEKGSTFNLIFEDSSEVPIENIQIGENRLSTNTIETLKNGNYTVNWKIVGADGHPIEGEFKFVVANENNELNDANNIEDESNGPSTTTEEGNSNETPSTAKEETTVSEEIEESNESNTIIPIVIGILLLIGIGTTILLLRKGKK
ncbi:copper resistance protein CopC (plasmid) [Metabacillus halosaccharovorans]|uniref:copper resistance CopC family protein n=1 Tax=Metabacillus halosaccharovorans TaxID=930124 RepID=UPI00203F2FEB|nr:copper resistance CopC family protein [Metabacillus halosaccharovorans]MCM3441350.1 copper resistance protein CopC [Metabacillus halosaccharovorans]